MVVRWTVVGVSNKTGSRWFTHVIIRCYALISLLHNFELLCRVFTNLSKGDYSAFVARWLTLHSWTLNWIIIWIWNHLELNWTQLFRIKVKVNVTMRLTVGESVCLGVEPHMGYMTSYLFLFDRYGLAFVERSLCREDGSIFLYAAGPRQCSLSRVRVPWDSRQCFTLSVLRLPFRRLLLLAGSRWRYSTPRPHGSLSRI
jgi:hypothetical protein